MKSVRPCVACGGLERRVLHRQRFADGTLGNGYDVVVCTRCGAGFADGIPTQIELDRYYAERSKYEYAGSGGAESPFDFKRFEAIVAQVEPLVPSREAAILDVGCATGGLLACFARRRYRRLLGSDPSPACAAAARRLHRIDVRPAVITQWEESDERFDLILLVGVLEHLRDARSAIGVILRLLAPGGLLYCAQPDAQAFSDCINVAYQQFSTEHVNFFSELSLNRLMGECGMVPRKAWRWMVEWREGVTDSVVSGLYGRADSSFVPVYDGLTEPALVRYLTACHEQDAVALLPKIESLVRNQQPVIIWGAGTLTRRLLASTRLAEANIVAFVDSNSHLQGTLLAGRSILAPTQIAGREETIFIASRAFKSEIERMIRDELGFTNTILTLS